MGACVSVFKAMTKDNGGALAPEAAKEETVPKAGEVPTKETTLEVAKPCDEGTTIVESVSKDVTITEVVKTTPEVTIEAANIAPEVSLTLKEDVTSEGVTMLMKDVAIEETVESPNVSDKSIVKESAKDEVKEESKDGEKVVDDSKLVEKITPEEKTLEKETEAKFESKDVETKKEEVKVVEEQKTDKHTQA